MQLDRIAIKNFRLLRDVELHLTERTTVLVGRNNTGKTSLTELFRRLFASGQPAFKLEDFSLSAYESFWSAFVLKVKGAEEELIREALPVIEVHLTINYSADVENLGPIADFVVDLDATSTTALLVVRYELADGKIASFFDDPGIIPGSTEDIQKRTLLKALKERVPRFYGASLFAVDPNDSSNTKAMEWSKLHNLFQSGFINAQRGLDDTTDRDKDVLGKVLESLFTTALSDVTNMGDHNAARDLELAVKGVEVQLDQGFNDHILKLIPGLSKFGYPGLHDPGLRTETTLDVQRLLTNHTKVRYTGADGVSLPETYNGLGARNLILILLQLLAFFKAFQARQSAPGVHMVFIEEPEAHLHPQMQEVFIRKLHEIAQYFSTEFNNNVPWPVQFVVSTHSSHLANETPFDSIRYFVASPAGTGLRATKIKDLSVGMTGTPKEHKEFLHQYMTLTRCDLMFADKAVLIEGTSERLLLPKMIQEVEKGLPANAKLSSQYLAIMEVGGAYAHRFFGLLDFLELPTLIITDLDAVDSKGTACKVSEGTSTSNGCIKDWFGIALSPQELLKKSANDKTTALRHLAYQVPAADGGPCGRSFEDAFMLANEALFGLQGLSDREKADKAWDHAQKLKKSQFALEYAIDQTGWAVPRYISDGLRWLAQVNSNTGVPLPPSTPTLQEVAAAKEVAQG